MDSTRPQLVQRCAWCAIIFQQIEYNKRHAEYLIYWKTLVVRARIELATQGFSVVRLGSFLSFFSDKT
jgi:hypothetical protein